jgi:hypothetical protein
MISSQEIKKVVIQQLQGTIGVRIMYPGVRLYCGSVHNTITNGDISPFNIFFEFDIVRL